MSNLHEARPFHHRSADSSSLLVRERAELCHYLSLGESPGREGWRIGLGRGSGTGVDQFVLGYKGKPGEVPKMVATLSAWAKISSPSTPFLILRGGNLRSLPTGGLS